MKKRIKLSIVLATRNEQENIADCLRSVEKIADEIIIVDEGSADDTRSIARGFGAEVFKVKHEPIFHITKQKAIDEAKGDWVLQLDADERVSPKLAEEIMEVVSASNEDLLKRRVGHSPFAVKEKLFKRHEALIREREVKLGEPTGEVVAFFIPRLNFFVGKPLRHAGVYPDAVIRLIKRGKARLPGKSVHEVMEVDGEVGWFFNDLEHHESPTLHRYIARANRYTDLTAAELKERKVNKDSLRLIQYSISKPLTIFALLYLRHRGYRDGMRGFLWSVFSALHHPLAYWKYYIGEVK